MKTSTNIMVLTLMTLPLVAVAGGSSRATYNQDEAKMAETKHWQTLSSNGEKIQVAYYQGNHPKTHQNSILVAVKKSGKVSTLYPVGNGKYSNGKITLVSLNDGGAAKIIRGGVTKVYQ